MKTPRGRDVKMDLHHEWRDLRCVNERTLGETNIRSEMKNKILQESWPFSEKIPCTKEAFIQREQVLLVDFLEKSL